MKYFTLLACTVLVLGGLGYWWTVERFTVSSITEVTPTPLITASTSAVVPATTSISEAVPSTRVKLYENETWGLRFEYPDDWMAYENTFRAGSSLFNVLLQPSDSNHLPDPIVINVTPPDWGQTLFDRAKERGDFSEVNVSTFDTITYPSTDMGLPTDVYLLQTPSGFWITIIVKEGYVNTLNQVLESLVITSVEVSM